MIAAAKTEKKQGILSSMKDTISMQIWAWQFIMPWKFQFFISVFCSLFENSWETIIMAQLIKATTQSLVDHDFSAMPGILLGVGISIVVGAVFFSMCYMSIYVCYAKGEGRMLTKFFDHVQNLPVPTMEKQLSGDFSTRLSTDVINATQMFGWPGVGEANFYATIVQAVVLSIVVILESPLVGVISVLLCALALAVTMLVNPHIKKATESKQTVLSSLTQTMVDLLSGNAIARIFGLVRKQETSYAEQAQESYRHAQTAARWSVVGDSLGMNIIWLAALITLTIGGLMAGQGKISIASIIFIFQLQINLNFAILEIGQNYRRLLGPAVSAKRVKEIFDMPLEIQRPSSVKPNMDVENAIEIENLTFSYEDGQEVLHGVSLHVKKGKRVAIVGGSGGGKSTLIKLLMEFAPRSGGELSLFGHGIDAYSQRGVRALSAYVPQDCYLFDGSMLENIRWGNPSATDQQIEQAASDVGMHTFILSLPEGYQTRVGERGTQLSGGQRQRVAIARAMLKDAPILLLDEATSSLDTESEQEVQAALERLLQGRTSVIVAHRLSTIRYADEIIVMEEGRIMERGTHDQLMSQDGRYKKLYQMQFV